MSQNKKKSIDNSQIEEIKKGIQNIKLQNKVLKGLLCIINKDKPKEELSKTKHNNS